MAKIELKGFEEWLRQLEAVRGNTKKLFKMTTYAGAKVLADELKAQTEALPTISDAEWIRLYRQRGDGVMVPALSETQKRDLLDNFGISTIWVGSDKAGTSVGFTGYNSIKSDRWPDGQPNAMVARSLEKGTSFLKRNRFVSRAVKACTKKAVEAMGEEADRVIERIIKENGG